MKILTKAAGAGLVCGLLVQAWSPLRAAGDAAGQPFQFKFDPSHPLVFSATTTTRTVTDRTLQVEGGNRSTTTTNLVETRYKFRLTAVRKSAGGVWTLHYEPFDFEEDLDTMAAGGHMTTTLRGLEVKSTQNEITVVDTAKATGMPQAKQFKQAVYTRLLGGNFEFQPAGVISKVDGDLPFVDFWTETSKYQIGFFDLVFPPESVAPGGSWTKTLSFKDWEGIKLGAAGLSETNTFVRQADAPAMNHFIPITVSLVSDQKDLMGSMDSAGQTTQLNISDFAHQKSGKFEFDPEAGCLASGDETETVKMAMAMVVQGHTMTMTTEMSVRSKFDLLKN
jgi:hypothetical protein